MGCDVLPPYQNVRLKWAQPCCGPGSRPWKHWPYSAAHARPPAWRHTRPSVFICRYLIQTVVSTNKYAWVSDSTADSGGVPRYRCIGYKCIGYKCIGYKCIRYKCVGYKCKGYKCVGYKFIGYKCVGYKCIGYKCIRYKCIGYKSTGYKCVGYKCIGYKCVGYKCIRYKCVGYKCIGYKCIGYKCIGYKCIGYKCIGYKCIGYKCIGYKSIGYKCIGCIPQDGGSRFLRNVRTQQSNYDVSWPRKRRCDSLNTVSLQTNLSEVFALWGLKWNASTLSFHCCRYPKQYCFVLFWGPRLAPACLLRRAVLRIRWMRNICGMALRGETEMLEEITCPCDTLFTTNPTWTDPAAIAAVRSDNRTTSCPFTCK